MLINGVDFKELECQKYWTFTSAFKGDKKAEIRNMIFSGDYIGSRKRDGALYKFVKDDKGNMGLFGRSKGVGGDYSEKLAWIPHLHNFFNGLPNGTCFLGELYLPHNEKSTGTTTIMGCLVDKAIQRQQSGEPLTYYIFDVLAYNGRNLVKETAQYRFGLLEQIKVEHPNLEWATYYRGEELWCALTEILAEGGEGIVITKANTCYQPGKRPARQTLKVKKELQENVDCIIVGANPPTKEYTGSKSIETWNYWINTNTNKKMEGQFYKDYYEGEPITPITKMYFLGGAGSLILGVYKDGQMVNIGNLSGLTEEILLNWKSYIGKVCEVTAMEIFYDNNHQFSGLRHPKFVCWRTDKNPKECQWNNI